MGLPPAEDEETDILIITKFNGVKTAFHVHGVEAIDKVRQSDISKPDQTIYGNQESMATGVAHFDGRLITILDFEKILADISPSTGIMPTDIDNLGFRDKSNKPILVAEDSPLLERLILESLEKAGFSNVICASNGQEAWSLLEGFKATGEPLDSKICCVITDIEMPLMDGHRLLKMIKSDSYLKALPVIVFSSLITEDMRAIGVKLGAAAQVSKPEIASLVSHIDTHIL
jgi:two-component system chemotaxis response regulator CheV